MNLNEENIDDPILSWVESEWIVATNEKDFKAHAKILRLLVSHVKSSEGIPQEFQKSVRDKVNYLAEQLEFMEFDQATQCVSCIHDARKKLDSVSEFGAGLKATLSREERAKIRKRSKPVSLGTTSVKSAQSSVHGGDDDL